MCEAAAEEEKRRVQGFQKDRELGYGLGWAMIEEGVGLGFFNSKH